MPMWDMHNRTTPEQARINRGRSNNGKIPAVEDTPRLMMIMMSISAWRVVEWFMTLPDPTPAQAGLVSVVTGAMTGAFAVWLGHEKEKGK